MGVAAAAAAAFVWLQKDPPARARCIVLITPDTLRRDHVGAYGPEADLTPRMDAFAREALRFDEARSPVPLTLPAHVTMLAGLPPGATGVRTNSERLPDRADRDYVLLPETLRTRGWHTAGFVSASVLGAPTGLGAVFAHYDDGNLREGGTLQVPERRGVDTVARALAHLRSRAPEEPVFLWVHLFDPHAPYTETTQYPGGVRAVDDAIGTLLAGVKAARGDDVCVLLAADHGEALEELGEPTHALLLGDAVLRVPFLLAAPDLAPGVRTDPAELADVAPTLAHAAGIPWPLPDVPGKGHNLWTPGPARPSIAESLDAHRRYRWAQLVGASDERGTLVDVGEGRYHWLPRAAPGQAQAGPRSPPNDAAIRALTTFIAEYKLLRATAPVQDNVPKHYVGEGGALALVDGAANALLPDPYKMVPRAERLSKLSQVVMAREMHTEGVLSSALGQIERMAGQDPGNPEVAFWRGMAEEAVANLAGGGRRTTAGPGPEARSTGVSGRFRAGAARPDDDLEGRGRGCSVAAACRWSTTPRRSRAGAALRSR